MADADPQQQGRYQSRRPGTCTAHEPHLRDVAGQTVSVCLLSCMHAPCNDADDCFRFGGTDGSRWFNDVWTYDPRTNAWTELDCIGYIPAPREGHAAALVDDTMYIFGGRVQDGSDLGDLAAFRISSRRWYMFQNMGSSPSARSGHSMTAHGKNIVVLGGEPSSAPHDPKELSLCYVLDTSKIRYPPSETAAAAAAPTGQAPQLTAPRKYSAGERSGIPVKGGAPGPGGLQYNREIQRPGTAPSGSGPPPLGQAPQPRTNGFALEAPKPKSKIAGPTGIRSPDELETVVTRAMSPRGRTPSEERPGTAKRPKSPPLRRSQENSRPGSSVSRTGSRANRNQGSLGSIDQHTRNASLEDARTMSRNTEILGAVDSGIGSSPALSHQTDELLRELDGARSRNAWYASELAMARKAGYQPTASSNAFLDEKVADNFAEDDRPLVEALLKMRSELARVQASLESQATEAANKVNEAERQRDSAINEAMYAKAKLAAHGGAQDEGVRDLAATPDADRAGDMQKRLATALSTHSDLQTKIARMSAETESERRARQLAEDTADAAEKRVAELEAYRQRTAGELEGLRAELHEAERTAREEAASSAEAISAHRLLEADHRELTSKHADLNDSTKDHTAIFENLHQAVTASTEKATLLESQLAQERQYREELVQEHTRLRSEHQSRGIELEQASGRLRDAQQLAEKHAEEARTHREAVLSGLGRSSSRGLNDATLQDERAEALQQQVTTATTLARRNQEAADMASEKLRRAEERIAGLEAYQEQSSREGLSMRKQLQVTTRDHQALQSDKAELQQQMERHRLESNALEVQLKTLKGLLEERGVTPGSAADRRSRALDSPSFRNFGTPDQARVRELEQQLEATAKSHEELRQSYEQREAQNSHEYNQKLATLENDHQAAVKYVRGIEKMLAKMKQELQRTKTARDDLEKQLVSHREELASRDVDPEAAARWDEERESLRAEMNEMQESMKTTMADLENQTHSLKSALDQSEGERKRLQQATVEQQQSHQQQLDSLTERARADLDHVRRENTILAERAKDAENKVQMFLDQFETSVDNYRRQSRMSMASAATPIAAKVNGIPRGHSAHDSVSGASLYSSTTSNDEDDSTAGQLTPSAPHFPHNAPDDANSPSKSAAHADVNGSHAAQGPHHSRDRSSTALDSLASELDALRTHWETTNKNYRLSDKFDFEKSPVSANDGGAGELGESLASWRKKLDLDEGADGHEGLGARKDSDASQTVGH